MSSLPIPPESSQAIARVPASPASFPRWLPPLFFALLSILFLWRSFFTGDVFLPAGLLGHVAPYKSVIPADAIPLWNPLRWDAVAQFYPWRLFAAQSLRNGILPLWNPYQFCGTPFVANSQSAVFYPPNLLFALFPTMRAFAVSAAFHLTLCGWFTYLLLRRLNCGEGAALLGGTVFAFSAWQIQWLQLPTFLATSCWIPLIFSFIHEIFHRKQKTENRKQKQDAGLQTPHTAQGLANSDNPVLFSVFCFLFSAIGLMLLAGHLQIAFYGLMAAGLWAIGLSLAAAKRDGMSIAGAGLGKCAAALVLGLMLAAPQILPALELSRVSHRAGPVTSAGYTAYTEYALNPSQLVTLGLPNFYGNDYAPRNQFWGYYHKDIGGGVEIGIRHNAAEIACYVGILPLLLAIFALVRGLQKKRFDRRILFFGLLALMALLMALGTPIDALLYFGVPGFGQSGSPARVLVLWAFASAILAAFGLDALLKEAPTTREKQITAGIAILLFAVALSVAIPQFIMPLQRMLMPTLPDVFSNVTQDWIRIAMMAVGAVLVFAHASRPHPQPLPPQAGEGSLNFSSVKIARGSGEALTPLPRLRGQGLGVGAGGLLLVIIDLFWFGIPVNPTSAPENVYPITPGVKLLQSQIGHERIFPVNQAWSLYRSPPAVLPPNGAMVFGLHDVQGYDSLLTRQYKEFANQFARPNRAGVKDASPSEVGNMVFFQNSNASLTPLTAAKFALTPATGDAAFQSLREGTPPGFPLYDAPNEMAIYPLSAARPRAALVVNGATVGAAEWREDGPTRVTLKTAAPTTATLVLADQFYPGWKATVDGNPATIYRAPDAPIYRAVSLSAEPHTVAFRYEPASVRLGIYLAGFACLLIFVPLGARLTIRFGSAVTNPKNGV